MYELSVAGLEDVQRHNHAGESHHIWYRKERNLERFLVGRQGVLFCG